MIPQDEKGNLINPDGWTLPVTTAKKKEELSRIGKYRSGRTVKVKVVSYSTDLDKDHRIIIAGPYRDGGQASVITSVDEMSVGNGRVFCYVYTASPFTDEGRGYEMGVIARYKFCDMDGDGKYELKGDGLGEVVIPDWAR